ncbi:hypothetical protein J1N35_007229 [Gossypium stocksii]|uniref:Uncharacterized protein n=1 Tax=Gossypium stocksii TaxID=47602 RepID=A0A9D4AFE1_9ROSI|nr:hypothetical protein J1N35_007229 [Gossypium stocksii]
MSELKGKEKVDDARLVAEMENKMMVEKEGLKSCHEVRVEEGKQDYLIGKQKNSLKPNTVVQVWSFRVQPNSQLGFALIKVIDEEDGYVID